MPENALDAGLQGIDERAPVDPPWPGFRAARLITSMKMRGDARSAAMLAFLIVVATMAVLGAAYVSTATEQIGALLGIGLPAAGPSR